MTKTTKILLIVLIIIILGAITYYTYNKYYKAPVADDTLLENSDDEWVAYNKRILETSNTGTVTEINGEKIIISTEDGDKEYKITGDTLYQKLGKPDENGQQLFETATAGDFKKDEQVWVFFDQLNPENATIIKLMNIDVNYAE